MSDFSDKALLPAGMCDVLPPDAECEAAATERLIACFSAHGYRRVKPPLIEFEESLLDGRGAAMSGQTFRLMDPVSQRMMGVRADMTLQVARIATTRMKNSPRPLRLCYGGQVLRIRGTQMRPERQFGQVGSELLGSWEPQADAEVILMAVEALSDLGVNDLSIDLALPTLVPALLDKIELDDESRDTLRAALDRKDEAAVGDLSNKLGKATADQLTAMLKATGPADGTLAALTRLTLPKAAANELASLAKVIEKIRSAAPDLSLTVDPVESRGLEYHSGVTFTIFATCVSGELGGGGRYLAGSDDEPATGMTLFMDTVLHAIAPAEVKKRLYLASGTDSAEGRNLRAEGWITIDGLSNNGDAKKEARRLGCSHYLSNSKVHTC
ncbi:MAG: ATP phosphoribosyltransferase regulatory subunit [Rhodospirillaceae bacterium]|nr:ATP phosphoribosyltransferase regulatory subunit [Rhodospirillaceae bacterium]MBL6941223.1 ATP phosphoribosyltransferase regulatory subunit [Rhodospirillales bacterium]